MAAKYRKIDPRVWYDEKFRTLESNDKLLAMYLLTCSQGNRIGIFHLSLALTAEQTGYPYDTLTMGISRVTNTLSWLFDMANSVLFFPTWWKYNGACGPKTMLGNMQDLHDVPQSQLIQQFAKERRYLSSAEFKVVSDVCDTYAIRMPYPSVVGAQEQEQEQEQDIKKNPLPPLESKKQKTKPEDLPLPSEIDTPEMKSAWNDWIQFRREKKKPLTPMTIKQNFSEFTTWGVDRSVAAIRYTIGRSWIGLKEPESNGQPNSRIPTQEDLDNWNPFDGGPGVTGYGKKL